MADCEKIGCEGVESEVSQEEWFQNCLHEYLRLDTKKRFSVNPEEFWKCLGDNTQSTSFDTHYVYHSAWAARRLAEIKPSVHIDISSLITFNVVVSAFIPVQFYDYRPAHFYGLNNIESKTADLTNLDFESNSIESLSCMHSIEHIGLGRYGDEIDPDGDLKAISELKRALKNDGHLLFVVPIGKPCLRYNAHRVYSYDMISEYFEGFTLMEYSLIPDNALEVGIIKNATKELTDAQIHGCGCFHFKK